MSYPSLEQYNEALQHPGYALADSAFKSATVAKNGLGLPLALCGGFALTYTVSASGRKYAVRCFHKQSNALEARYRAISRRLSALESAYFVDFEFQSQGVRVDGRSFPVVKMAWASGVTLGDFLERGHRDPAALSGLHDALMALAGYLELQRVAHGDVQPGNVMVSSDGRSVQLIDYDGMYVDELKALGSAELGLRNFQHPQRNGSSWDTTLDRFSFIVLSLALRALQLKPGLWDKYQADEMGLLFRANDLAQPRQSAVFRELMAMPELSLATKGFAAICESTMDKVPSVADFLALRNIPVGMPTSPVATTPSTPTYMAAFPVVPASSYTTCLAHVGDRVELIGHVTEVRRGTTKHGKPYVFVNFGNWKGSIVKLNIWAEGLAALSSRPDESWQGKWVSVQGLMEPPFRNPRYGYSHLAISITQAGQMHVIKQSEARYRLAGSSTRSAAVGQRSGNAKVLEALQTGRPAVSRTSSRHQRPTAATGQPRPATRNQAVLQSMRGSQSSQSSGHPQSAAPAGSGPPPKQPSRAGCLAAIGHASLLFSIVLMLVKSMG